MASFMPGEWDWMGGGQAQGLLGNPALQMGLGILANNTGNYGALGPALGRGMSQGLRQVQASRQFDQQSKLYQLRLAAEQREQEEAERKRAALDGFDEKFPEYKGLADINPTAALKIAYPNLSTNTADPYTEVIYDEQGRAWLNNRRETDPNQVLKPITIDGKPFIGAKVSPELAGRLEGSKARAKGDWKPTDMLDGSILTESQLAQQAMGGMPQQPMQQPQSGLPSNNFNTPYPVTMGAPGTTATDRMEGTVTDNLGVGNPARPNPGGGIRVPTAAEKAAQAEAAKIEAEAAAKARTGLSQAVSQAETTIRLVDEMIGSEDGTIPEHPGFRTAVGMSSKLDPRNYLAGTDATGFNTRLDQLKGQQFMQAFETLKGGGQITEVEGKKATDAIARMNTATTEEEFITGAREFQSVIRTGMERAKRKAAGGDKQQIIPQGAAGGTVNQPRKPMKGQKVDGYKFMGGDPADPANWKKL